MATPDRSIPQDLLDNAHCIVIAPGLKKGAFIIGAKYAKAISVAGSPGLDGARPDRFASREAAWDFKSEARNPM
jgi:lipid-binding SYLF domain-containing protein